MSLQLILGSSGTGKSYTLYQEMIRNSREDEKTNYLIIVPEQFTMQTQKDLVAMHPNHGIMNIDVLSFLRLANRVFDEHGGNDRLILEDTGKNMILRKVVQEKQKELILFESNVKKQGFVGQLKSMLSEIFQYSIDEEQLEHILELTKHRPMLNSKMKDILTVYQGFKEFLSEKYMTEEEILDVLSDMVKDTALIKNSVICMDGFTGFTPSQYNLVTMLMKYAKKLIITITIDSRENMTRLDEEFKLFHLSKKTIHKLRKIAMEERVELEEDIILGKKAVPYRFLESSALAALERNLFRYPLVIFEKEQEDVKIHEAKDIAHEVTFVVREVNRLIREERYRYKDIAIVTGDMASYGRVLHKELEREGIPCFIDNKRDILSNPFAELIRSVLEVVIQDYSYESMFRYLRCGMVDFQREEIDFIENYVIALGIRGRKRWSQTWERKYRTKKEIDMERLNEIRERIYDQLETVQKVLKEKEHNVEDFTRGLYEFIVSLRIEEKLWHYKEIFTEENDLLRAKEFSQVYRIVIELLDKMVELLGDEVMTVKEYSEILTSGLEEAKVGLIPPGTDQIVVGDIERTRLKDIKALFFVGVNDGNVPKASGSGGIISDVERQLLADYKVEVAPTRRESAYMEQFYLYLNLTKPQNKLYITYSKVGTDGKTLRPSYLIGKLKTLFPKLQVTEELDKMTDLEHILGGRRGMDYLREGIRSYRYEEMTTEWKELFSWYFRKEDFKDDLIKMIDGAFYINREKGLSKAVAHMLYGNELNNSVTRLEQYAACAFAHFLEYGMELSKRAEYQIAVPDLGNIFHNAIDLFSQRLLASEYDWHSIPEEVREQFVKDSVLEAASDYGNTILRSSKRNEYIISRVERITKRTVWALCQHIKKGEFEPSGFELQFSYLDNLETVQIPLSDTERMRLRGRIDRIDTCEDKENVYVKVIDYKSGNQTFDIVSLYYGLQLQLVVYLNAALEMTQIKNPDKTVIPAGIFYYHIDDPIIDKVIDTNNTGDDLTDEINDMILKELKLNGMVNDDLSIAGLMDKTLLTPEGAPRSSAKSAIIPVETNKDGYPTKRSNIASLKQFEVMERYTTKKITQLGQEIINGGAEVNPYKLGDKTACDYCDFRGICGFDTKLPGNTYRNLKKYEKEEVWNLWKDLEQPE